MSLQNDVDQEFGGYSSMPVITESYYPTRLEYFAGKALEGLLAGRPLKEYDNCVKYAVELGKKMEKAIDTAQG